jgi:hypothetical protein
MPGWLLDVEHAKKIHGPSNEKGKWDNAEHFSGVNVLCSLWLCTIPLKIIMRVRTRCVLYGFNDGDDDYRYDDYMEFSSFYNILHTFFWF